MVTARQGDRGKECREAGIKIERWRDGEIGDEEMEGWRDGETERRRGGERERWKDRGYRDGEMEGWKERETHTVRQTAWLTG